MDLDLLTIAKRGSLGATLSETHKKTIEKFGFLKALVNKIDSSQEFSSVEKEFNRMSTIISEISLFENYLNDILFNTLVSFPKKFGKKQFDIEELKEAGSLLALFEKKATQLILELAYGKFDAYIERFSKIMEVSQHIAKDKIQIINEIKCTRDAYIHNDGKANNIYFQKSGNRSRADRQSQKLLIDIDYVLNSIDQIIDFLEELFNRLPTYYKNFSHRRVFRTMWENTCLNERVKFEMAWDILDEENFVIKDTETEYGFSHSEVEIYRMFKDIYLGTDTTDFGLLFRRWGPNTKEHQIALSWLNYPFWL
jgi:hypothetical protein